MDFDAGRDVVVAILKLLKADVDRNSSKCVCERDGQTIRKFCQEPVWRKLGDFNSVATHWRDGSRGIRPMSSALANLRLRRREDFSAYVMGINEKLSDYGAIPPKSFEGP